MLFLTICLCGCSEKEKAGILFNKEPITKMNVAGFSQNGVVCVTLRLATRLARFVLYDFVCSR